MSSSLIAFGLGVVFGGMVGFFAAVLIAIGTDGDDF